MRRAGGGALALVVGALALSGCSTAETASEGSALTVYVSLPTSGPAAPEGRDAADGARLALADGPPTVDGFAIEAEFLDAGEPGPGWSAERSAANARTAAQDASAIAYLGDFHSGATRASLPVTNEAHMLQVSPASGAPDLVAPNTASDDVPDDVQTSGERTFGRVIPSDDAQARAAAAWAGALGAHRVALREDGTAFGSVLANAFAAETDAQGVEAGRRGPITYFAGSPDRFASLHDDVVHSGAGGRPVRMASDAFLAPYARVSAKGGRVAISLTGPARVTSAALDPSHLPRAGREFARRFEAEFGRAPGRYAAYGYEAMAVILDAIERAGNPADRESVIAAFFDTAGRDSILGSYSITKTGETTLARITGYELRESGPAPVAKLAVP